MIIDYDWKLHKCKNLLQKCYQNAPTTLFGVRPPRAQNIMSLFALCAFGVVTLAPMIVDSSAWEGVDKNQTFCG